VILTWYLLARDIAKQIEAELEYPGQIKVNVIRESQSGRLRKIIFVASGRREKSTTPRCKTKVLGRGFFSTGNKSLVQLFEDDVPGEKRNNNYPMRNKK
jgi:hypothetical protein